MFTVSHFYSGLVFNVVYKSIHWWSHWIQKVTDESENALSTSTDLTMVLNSSSQKTNGRFLAMLRSLSKIGFLMVWSILQVDEEKQCWQKNKGNEFSWLRRWTTISGADWSESWSWWWKTTARACIRSRTVQKKHWSSFYKSFCFSIKFLESADWEF